MPTLEITTAPSSPAKPPPAFPSLWNAKGLQPHKVYMILRRETAFDAPRMPGAAGPVDYSLVAVPLWVGSPINSQVGVDLGQFTPFVGTVTLESK